MRYSLTSITRKQKGNKNLFELARFLVIEGNWSVRQDQGKLQTVRVSEEFELNGSRGIEV